MFTPDSREKAKAARRAAPTRRMRMAAFAETFAQQRRQFPRMALPIINQAEKGNQSAAIMLMCLDCACWVRQEIRDCIISSCPMYPHRPYQQAKGSNPNDP